MDSEWLFALLFCLAMGFGMFHIFKEDAKARKSYSEGWDDCYELMKKMSESEREEEILKYLKKSTEQILRDDKKYKHGDYKAIKECRDIKELKSKIGEIIGRE